MRGRVRSTPGSTALCGGRGRAVDATLDWHWAGPWAALARDGYSGVEVAEYHKDIRYEQEWYGAIDI